jgi:hypothetical protein
MKRIALVTALFVVAAGSYALGANTEPTLTATYDTLADVILGAKQSEANLVKAILGSHRAHAKAAADAGRWDEAAAQIALFANEGDNAVGGIRKRLLEGGHHHNAEGEAKGVYEPGYVIVTAAVKKQALDVAAKIQAAKDDGARKAAWAEFEKAADTVCPAR